MVWYHAIVPLWMFTLALFDTVFCRYPCVRHADEFPANASCAHSERTMTGAVLYVYMIIEVCMSFERGPDPRWMFTFVVLDGVFGRYQCAGVADESPAKVFLTWPVRMAIVAVFTVIMEVHQSFSCCYQFLRRAGVSARVGQTQSTQSVRMATGVVFTAIFVVCKLF
eukprot:TRINITY_DN14270_c0_g1_i1.p1 TRINITY_DN14270_c0_g1~~TRINITY_DN14270_c0_g1_i1.p1  ORF type:complete len:167 (-),score=14.04 TRINITY_DN14270_c0_g1_i1:176-676(-)